MNKLFMCAVVVSMLGVSAGASAQSSAANDYLKKSRKVATVEKVGNGSVIVCNPKLMNDTMALPLTFFTEDIKLVKLDDREDALIGEWVRTTITDNYILVSNHNQTPFKLFDKTGKYLAAIGAYGQGPDEYLNTYDQQLDEKNKRIYILPWQSNKILVYNFKGEALKHIPLPVRVPKGKFRVDADKNLVTVTVLPFEGIPAVVWTQDLEGNRKNFVPAGHLVLPRDFSNEVDMGRNTANYDVMLVAIAPPRQDTLYHYNHAANKLEAKFTLDFGKGDISWHSYNELPKHFWGDFQFPKQVSEGNFIGTKPVFFIVDKEALKGNFFYIYNDLVGTSDRIDWPSFKDGYFVQNMEPAILMQRIEKELKNTKLPADRKTALKKMLESLDEDGNNVVLYAKLKK